MRQSGRTLVDLSILEVVAVAWLGVEVVRRDALRAHLLRHAHRILLLLVDREVI